MNLICRLATSDDAELIHRFIIELADFEKSRTSVVATPDMLRTQLSSDKPPFECLIAELDNMPIGFAIFYQNYSTWEGKPGIHLEDIYVMPRAQGLGVGHKIFEKLKQIAYDRDYKRMDWVVLDWNTTALSFYRKQGAKELTAWKICRLQLSSENL